MPFFKCQLPDSVGVLASKF